MKKVALSQLRSEMFDATSVIEGCVEVDPGSTQKTFAALGSVLSDLDSLREALFFKSEKLKSRVNSDDKKRCEEIAAGIETLVGRLEIPMLGDSRTLLEKHRAIGELRAVQKLIRYAMEMDRDPTPVLDALLASDSQDDWVFLGSLLSRSIRCGRDKEVVISFSRRIETKMIEIFKTSLRSEDLVATRATFQCLKELGKEMLLVDTFLGYIAEEVGAGSDTKAAESFDLDAEPDCGAFGELVDRLSSATGSCVQRARTIFGGDPRFIADIFTRLYRTVLFPRLDDFLSTSHPLSFLHGVTAAAVRLRSFGAEVSSRVPRFESDVILHEGLGKHLARVVQQEKLLFDEAFDVLTKNSGKESSYLTLLGSHLKPAVDPRMGFERMLVVVYMALRRSTQLYTHEDEAELLGYFFRRLAAIVDAVEADSSSPIAAVANLTNIFLLTRRLLGPRLGCTGGFTRKIKDATKAAFDAQIETATSTIRKRMEGLTFSRPDSHAAALTTVRELISVGEVLHGQNYHIYARTIFRSTYERLTRAVLGIVYAPDQGENMQHALDEFVGCATLLNNIDAVRWFSHLREMGRLIAIDPAKFTAKYAEYAGSISEQELKDILRCRKDRDEIRRLL